MSSRTWWAIAGVSVVIALGIAWLSVVAMNTRPTTHQGVEIDHLPDHDGPALNVTMEELVALHPDWDTWLAEARAEGQTRHSVPVETVATFWEALPAVDRKQIIRVDGESYQWAVITP